MKKLLFSFLALCLACSAIEKNATSQPTAVPSINIKEILSVSEPKKINTLLKERPINIFEHSLGLTDIENIFKKMISSDDVSVFKHDSIIQKLFDIFSKKLSQFDRMNIKNKALLPLPATAIAFLITDKNTNDNLKKIIYRRLLALNLKKIASTIAKFKNLRTTIFENPNLDSLIKEKILGQMILRDFDPNVFFTTSPNDIPDIPFAFSKQKMDIISNNDGYLPNSALTNNGQPLLLEDGTPIGYNIHLPKESKVNAILVQIYGGTQSSKRESKALTPSPLSTFANILIENGIAYITLNLPDLLELTVNQSRMAPSLHDRIHQAINKFYETITLEPEKLHPSLIKLKNLPIMLYGRSFGGRTSIRHSELYPKTFTRYISHDGALSSSHRDKGFRPRSPRSSHLDPLSHLEQIQDPILLLHNLDDHNVHVSQSIEFYKLARKHGKNIRLFITESSNKMPELSSARNKGHFQPESQEALKRYMSVLIKFVKEGPASIPEFSDWHANEYEHLANAFLIDIPFKERCLSQMFKLYKTGIRFKGKQLNPGQLIEKDKEELVWNEFYKPLFKAYHYANQLFEDLNLAEQERQRLINKALLTPKVLERTAENYLYNVPQFVEEYYHLNIPQDFEWRRLINTILPSFQRSIEIALKGGIDTYLSDQFLIQSLYLANPELVPLDDVLSKEKIEDQDKEEAELRDDLLKEIHKNRALMFKAFKTSAVPQLIEKKNQIEVEKEQENAKILYKSLLEAIKNNDLISVKDLIERGVDVNLTPSSGHGAPPLSLAKKASLELIETLLQAGAIIPPYMAILAAHNGNIPLLELLVKYGASVTGDKPLYSALYLNQIKTAEWLVSQGADVNFVDSDGNTLLHQISQKAPVRGEIAKLQAMEFLVEKGANVNALDKQGESPLFSAAKAPKATLDSVKYLVSQGADLLIKNTQGLYAWEDEKVPQDIKKYLKTEAEKKKTS